MPLPDRYRIRLALRLLDPRYPDVRVGPYCVDPRTLDYRLVGRSGRYIHHLPATIHTRTCAAHRTRTTADARLLLPARGELTCRWYWVRRTPDDNVATLRQYPGNVATGC